MTTPAADRAETKPCAVCGCTITWRKKWEKSWPAVRYCSDACRRRARSSSARPLDAALESAILTLLAERGRGKTICPSEAARRVAAEADTETDTNAGAADDPHAWHPLMEPARAAARRLHAAGRIRILQGGHPVDPSRARGPIRLQRVESAQGSPANTAAEML
jgi:hypothetical protein